MGRYRIRESFLHQKSLCKIKRIGGKTEMKQYGQAEYAEAVLNSIAEKMLKAGILTEQQYKQLCKQNYADCYRQFCTAYEA